MEDLFFHLSSLLLYLPFLFCQVLPYFAFVLLPFADAWPASLAYYSSMTWTFVTLSICIFVELVHFCARVGPWSSRATNLCKTSGALISYYITFLSSKTCKKWDPKIKLWILCDQPILIEGRLTFEEGSSKAGERGLAWQEQNWTRPNCCNLTTSPPSISSSMLCFVFLGLSLGAKFCPHFWFENNSFIDGEFRSESSSPTSFCSGDDICLMPCSLPGQNYHDN